MMKGTGRQGKIELSIGDQRFAVINDRSFEFEIGGVAYRVKRTGVFAAKYWLLHDQELVIVAQQVPLRSRFKIGHAGKQWLLKADGLSAKRYDLFRETERVGRIAPARWNLYKDITIDLPDELSQPAQVFLLWLIVRHWPD
jgi:hypothetical protein